jgi:hypothetical protein
VVSVCPAHRREIDRNPPVARAIARKVFGMGAARLLTVPADEVERRIEAGRRAPGVRLAAGTRSRTVRTRCRKGQLVGVARPETRPPARRARSGRARGSGLASRMGFRAGVKGSPPATSATGLEAGDSREGSRGTRYPRFSRHAPARTCRCEHFAGLHSLRIVRRAQPGGRGPRGRRLGGEGAARPYKCELSMAE